VSRKWFPGLKPSRSAPADLDTSVPHPARIYDYILGGKDSFAADQAAARAAVAANPHLVTAMRENRAAVRRAGAYNRAGIAFQYWTRDEFERFLAGLQLVPPGIVPMAEWRADGEPQPRPSPLEAGGYVAVARKD
jgi:S-adenosyl methyltransferase